MSPCAVTGASGYVGGLLTERLRQSRTVVRLVRKPAEPDDIAWSLQGGADNLAAALRERGVETLVHAAWDMSNGNAVEVERNCVEGSQRLFAEAVKGGVKRIVFISTISAFEGCRSSYGQSKLKVEKSIPSEATGIIFRPGLVFGTGGGGMFGKIRNQTRTAKYIPVIGSGNEPQYLLAEAALADAMNRAVAGDFDTARGKPLVLANPKPWPFRELVESIAKSIGREVRTVAIPWQMVYAGLRVFEMAGVKMPFRSDSVISFVHYDRNPAFDEMRSLGIDPPEYQPGIAL